MGHPDYQRRSKRAQENIRKQIERMAYLLWDIAGQPSGQDQEFWNEAERRIYNDDAIKDLALRR